MTNDSRQWRTTGAVDPATHAQLLDLPPHRAQFRPQVRPDGSVEGYVLTGGGYALAWSPTGSKLAAMHALLSAPGSSVEDFGGQRTAAFVSIVDMYELRPAVEVRHSDGRTTVRARKAVNLSPIDIPDRRVRPAVALRLAA